jgi:hypothetical protein
MKELKVVKRNSVSFGFNGLIKQGLKEVKDELKVNEGVKTSSCK